jgi:hypothetical protein
MPNSGAKRLKTNFVAMHKFHCVAPLDQSPIALCYSTPHFPLSPCVTAHHIAPFRYNTNSTHSSTLRPWAQENFAWKQINTKKLTKDKT